MHNGPRRLDAFIEGQGVRRGAILAVSTVAFLCDDVSVPWEDVFWVSRRKGMLLIFAGRATVAVKGPGHELDKLYQRITAHVDLTGLRRRIVRELGHEVVLFTAGCAASGAVDGHRIGGLFVAAATRRALYLLSRGEQWTVPWPAQAARRRPARSADRGDQDADYVVLARGETSLTLRYLFPEELGAILYAASRGPDEQTRGRTLELFSRREVSRPTPAELPEFSLAAGSLQEVAGRAAANVPRELQNRAVLPPFFFESHFLQLGEIALGPLLLRKSAATNAVSLRKAVSAMDAAGLQVDTRAAVAGATDRLVTVYEDQLERVLEGRQVSARLERELALAPEERRQLGERMLAPFDRLWTRFRELESQQAELLRLLEQLEEGPPDEDDGPVREAATDWRATMSRLDSGYEGAWRELVEEIERSWSTDLLPRLARATSAEAHRVPEWVQLVAIALITLVVAIVLVYLLVL